MQLGMIGLGRMGSNMALRLLAKGHDCVVYDPQAKSRNALVAQGATTAASVATLVKKVRAPRAIWLMVGASVVDGVLAQLIPLLEAGDSVIDGGNSNFKDSIRRAEQLKQVGLHYLDVGVSGGVWGRERGYCLMIGGAKKAVGALDSIFASLAPGADENESTNADSAHGGYLHVGPSGAGHFVKMVHNGIEYGLMAAYAEGFNLLAHGERFDLDLPQIAQLWRRGSVIGSWLLDLTARALEQSPTLAGFKGQVPDSGEGRWTLHAALDAAVPMPVLASALAQRFSSRGENQFADRLLSALRNQFGGHLENVGAGKKSK